MIVIGCRHDFLSFRANSWERIGFVDIRCMTTRPRLFISFRALIAAIGSTLTVAATAHAQTGPELLLKPFPTSEVFDGSADAVVMRTAKNEPGDTLQFSEYESSGRFRLMPGNEASPRIGYDFNFLDSRTSSKLIPHELSDESIAFGTPIAKYHDWVAGLTLGGGYAGDTAFARGGAYYLKAAIGIGRQFDSGDILGIIVDYNGNRTYFPDFPLPGFAYAHALRKNLQLVVGVPYSHIHWEPIEHLKFDGGYTLLSDLDAVVGYEFLPRLTLYAKYEIVRDAFHVAGLPEDRRLLFQTRRAEMGLHWDPCKNCTLTVAGGYAFANRFRTGFDFVDTDKLIRFSDQPYVRAGFELKY